MTITVLPNRQYPIVATANHTFVLTEAASVTENAMLLPAQSAVIGGSLGIVTNYADDAAETFTMDIGTLLPLDIDAFLDGVSVDGDEDEGYAFVAPASKVYTSEVQVTFAFLMSTGSSSLTAGESNLYVMYIMNTRGSREQYG